MAKRKPFYECGRDDCPGTTGTSHPRDACERVISERVWHGRQSVNFERIVERHAAGGEIASALVRE